MRLSTVREIVVRPVSAVRRYTGLEQDPLAAGRELGVEAVLFPQAKAAALKALALDDTLAEAHTSLAQVKEVYELDFPGAEREYKRAIELNPDELERSPNRRNSQLYFKALAYAELGDKERAFALMEKLYEIRSHDLLGLKNGPAWDGLRADPRFQDLLRRFGLSSASVSPDL